MTRSKGKLRIFQNRDSGLNFEKRSLGWIDENKGAAIAYSCQRQVFINDSNMQGQLPPGNSTTVSFDEFKPHFVCNPDDSEAGHNGEHEKNDDLVGHEY